MCWNANISLTTFIYALISAVIVYFLGEVNIFKIITLLLISSIQLFEYFVWINLENKIINNFLSKIGLLIILSQIALINYLNNNDKIKPFLFVSLSFILFLFILTQLEHVDFRTLRAKNGHLMWLWLDLPLIWIILGLTYYLIPFYFHINGNPIVNIFISITLIISLYTYFKFKTWGSMWCYFSNIAWIFLIIYSIYKKFY